MALFGRKKKKEEQPQPKASQPSADAAKGQKLSVAKEEKPQKKEAPASVATSKATKSVAWRQLRAPHITEKASLLGEKGQYTFKVTPRANKSEVKKAIEQAYDVTVTRVRFVSMPSKAKRLGRFIGTVPGYKKAIVKLKEGQHIEILPH